MAKKMIWCEVATNMLTEWYHSVKLPELKLDQIARKLKTTITIIRNKLVRLGLYKVLKPSTEGNVPFGKYFKPAKVYHTGYDLT